MAILNFNQFVNEKYEDINLDLNKTPAVGVAVVWNNKILLVHPTGASWQRGTCGIPKGGLDPGENLMDGALRELKEETGVILSKGQLNPEPQVVDFYSKKNKVDRQLIYFICEIQDPSEIGLESGKVPKSQLQLEEIDWAGFVGPSEAYPITSRVQLIILDRLLKINN
jgi:ADP-ribose pyrophosphatase YjhB (NUDIX family)